MSTATTDTTATWLARDHDALAGVLPRYYDVVAERGEGSWLVDVDGRRYLDLGAGIAVNTTGHAHPRVVAARVRPWKARRKAITPGFPVILRASLRAPSTASAPELQKNTWGSSRKGQSAPMRSASATLRVLCTTTEVWTRVAAWVEMASTTRGWQWPVVFTAMPAPRSR